MNEPQISKPTPHEWEVLLENGWVRIDPPEVQVQLSAANAQGQPTYTFTTRRGEVDFLYEVDFARNLQKNLNNGTNRNIRRNPLANAAPPNAAAALQRTPSLQAADLQGLPSAAWEVLLDVKDGGWTRIQPPQCQEELTAAYKRAEPAWQFTTVRGTVSFEYHVDFGTMIQTNRNNGKQRNVRNTALVGAGAMTVQPAAVPGAMAAAAGAMGAAPALPDQGMSILTWEIELEQGWTRLDPPEVQETLTKAFDRKDAVCRFTSRRGSVDFEYEVDFGAMTQKNVAIGTLRRIRHNAPQEAKLGQVTIPVRRGTTPHGWEVLLDSGWLRMEPEYIQVTLSDAQSRNDGVCTYRSMRGSVDFEYQVNFQTMMQKNVANGTERQIRNTLGNSFARNNSSGLTPQGSMRSAGPSLTPQGSFRSAGPYLSPQASLRSGGICIVCARATPGRSSGPDAHCCWQCQESGGARHAPTCDGPPNAGYGHARANAGRQMDSLAQQGAVGAMGPESGQQGVGALPPASGQHVMAAMGGMSSGTAMLFMSCQLTVTAVNEIEAWMCADKPLKVKASLPKFNLKTSEAWGLTRIIAFDVPCFGPLLTRAVLDLFKNSSVQKAASDFQIKVPQYTLNRIVQEKVSRVRGITAEATKLKLNGNAIGKLTQFVDAVEHLTPAHFDNPDQWLQFVNKFCSPGWENRLHVNEVLGNFGFSLEEVQALKGQGQLDNAIRWLAKAFDSFGLPGSLADIVNLVFAMMDQEPGKPSNHETVQILQDFNSRLRNEEWDKLWVPTHMIHDVEYDDLAAWLLVAAVHSRRQADFKVMIQLPHGDAFATLEGKLRSMTRAGSSPVQVFRDHESSNAANVHEAGALFGMTRAR